MFDIGFSELLVCLIVALVVLGPEKLPRVARTVGRWSGQAKGYLRNLSAELDRETQFADLKKQLDEAHRAVREGASGFRDSVQQNADEIRRDAEGREDLTSHDNPAPQPPTGDKTP